MARGAFSTSNYFSSGTPVTNEPFTVACWFYPLSDNNAVNYLCHLNIGGTNANGWALRIDFNITNNPIRAYKINGGSAIAGEIASIVNLNAWNFGAGLYVSDTSRYVYCNGTLSAQSTTNVADVTVTQLFVGCGRSASTGNPFGPFDGYIGMFALWDVILTTEELNRLNAKVCPLFVRPASLKVYAPLIDSREYDVRGGVTFTENGTVAVQPHPSILYPKRRALAYPIPAVAPSYIRPHRGEGSLGFDSICGGFG